METAPPSPPPPPSIPPAPPPPPPPARRGWWSRNWKWFVPTGCLTMFVLFAMFIFGIVVLVFGAMKHSDAYKEAVSRAKHDVRVQRALGSHIRDGMFPSGSTNVTGATGEAELSIPIHGRKGKGTIYLSAKKVDGEWRFSKLIVKTNDGEVIDLSGDDESNSDESDDDTT